MFCVGDIVVYGAHGLCKVDGIGPLPMKFADKSKRYYLSLIHISEPTRRS